MRILTRTAMVLVALLVLASCSSAEPDSSSADGVQLDQSGLPPEVSVPSGTTRSGSSFPRSGTLPGGAPIPNRGNGGAGGPGGGQSGTGGNGANGGNGGNGGNGANGGNGGNLQPTFTTTTFPKVSFSTTTLAPPPTPSTTATPNQAAFCEGALGIDFSLFTGDVDFRTVFVTMHDLVTYGVTVVPRQIQPQLLDIKRTLDSVRFAMESGQVKDVNDMISFLGPDETSKLQRQVNIVFGWVEDNC